MLFRSLKALASQVPSAAELIAGRTPGNTLVLLKVQCDPGTVNNAATADILDNPFRPQKQLLGVTPAAAGCLAVYGKTNLAGIRHARHGVAT